MAKCVAIANQKGGVAKTTTSINLSACLAQRGYKVLLVDVDPQGNATSGLGINRAQIEHCIYDVLINSAPAVAVLIATDYTNLDILPATIQLAGAEVELVSAIARETKLSRAIKTLVTEYDFVLFDCPPSLGLLTINALCAADSILVPLQCEYYALEGLGQLLATYDLVQKNLNPVLAIEGILLTMYDGRTNLAMQVADEARRYFPDKVFEAIIPRSVRLSEAPSHGMPIIYYDAKSKGSEQYWQLTDEFLKQNGQSAKKKGVIA